MSDPKRNAPKNKSMPINNAWKNLEVYANLKIQKPIKLSDKFTLFFSLKKSHVLQATAMRPTWQAAFGQDKTCAAPDLDGES